MDGKERRERILQLLTESESALSGGALAKQMQVSRQVIVQDIALLRANGSKIISTNQGYLLDAPKEVKSVFKVQHTDEQVEEELCLIVDCGGMIEDVFIFHKVYGTVRAEMNIHNRKDVRQFMSDITSGKSSLLKNVTSGYHYHTVRAKDKETLSLIKEKLREKGFLAKLQDFEPIDFWRTHTGD